MKRKEPKENAPETAEERPVPVDTMGITEDDEEAVVRARFPEGR